MRSVVRARRVGVVILVIAVVLGVYGGALISFGRVAVGKEYVFYGVGPKGVVHRVDTKALSDLFAAAKKIRPAIPLVVLDVSATQDTREYYQVNLPSPSGAHNPISGCATPRSLLFGIVQVVPVWMDYPGLKHEYRDNGLAAMRSDAILVDCVVYGLSSGDTSLYTQILGAVHQQMGSTVHVFSVE